jgi:hypothetical protein
MAAASVSNSPGVVERQRDSVHGWELKVSGPNGAICIDVRAVIPWAPIRHGAQSLEPYQLQNAGGGGSFTLTVARLWRISGTPHTVRPKVSPARQGRELRMAYKMKIPESWLKSSPNTGRLGYLYNLDSAVGENCANRADDVMLVQYILMTTLADPKSDHLAVSGPTEVHDFFDWVGAQFAADANFAIQMGEQYRRLAATFFDNQAPLPTGKCDSVTITWIRMFQMRNLRRFVTAIDGRVDPIIPAQGPLAKSTMIRLNVALPIWRTDIAKSDAPAAVKSALRDFRQ